MKSDKNKGKWIFFIAVVMLYLLSYLISKKKFFLISDLFIKLIIQIMPVFLLVYVLMVSVNYFVNNEQLQKLMKNQSGIKIWLIAIVSGILSIGPIYMWYPLMKELQKSGVKNRFIATFLYNRGIKLQWLPMLILYFGWKYSATLLIIMAICSIPQGIITEKWIGNKVK